MHCIYKRFITNEIEDLNQSNTLYSVSKEDLLSLSYSMYSHTFNDLIALKNPLCMSQGFLRVGKGEELVFVDSRLLDSVLVNAC